MANLITLPIYKLNGIAFEPNGTRYYRDFAVPSAGIVAQPVAHPNNVVNGAIIYSAIKSAHLGDAVLYSNKTVAEIVTAANA
jgi:hypothetical protein